MHIPEQSSQIVDAYVRCVCAARGDEQQFHRTKGAPPVLRPHSLAAALLSPLSSVYARWGTPVACTSAKESDSVCCAN
eukprot:769575-Pyramimonas_sp.AAC.3